MRKVKPIKGTKTMYIAVRKADFPAFVETMPNCCRLAAKNRGIAQQTAAFHSCLSAKRVRKFLPSFFFLSNKNITGSNPIAPNPHRIAWNVKGPTWSIPILWATKVDPQIITASSRLKLPWSCFFIISPTKLYHIPTQKARIAFSKCQCYNDEKPIGGTLWKKSRRFPSAVS